jgi:NAD-dependent deacetylase
MKQIVVLTGSGISAESGLKTFREAGGLWEGYDVTEVASPQGFAKDPELVLQFYNERRAQALRAQPNEGHKWLVKLEEKYQVQIITQNVDNLHERAGSSHVLHLHGELCKVRSVTDASYIIETENDIKLGDLAPDGGQLRPHIVWFGESVPMFTEAVRLMTRADIVIVVGTSMVVYPANTLVEYAPAMSPIYVVDPNRPEIYGLSNLYFIEERGSVGVPKLVKELMGLS